MYRGRVRPKPGWRSPRRRRASGARRWRPAS